MQTRTSSSQPELINIYLNYWVLFASTAIHFAPLAMLALNYTAMYVQITYVENHLDGHIRIFLYTFTFLHKNGIN